VVPIFAAPAATAQGSPSVATPAATALAASDPNKIVCRSMPPETGTPLGSRRKFQTQAEWDDRERADEQALMKIQSQGF